MRRVLSGFLIGTGALLASTATGGATAADPIGGPPIPRLKPPAPTFPWLSAEDEALLRGVLDAVGDRSWSTARALTQRIEAPVARSVADWTYLRADAPDITAAEIGRFLDGHYGWPQEETLQRRAEELFEDTTPPETILAFFDRRDPISGEGELQLARAFLSQGNVDAARTAIRRAWVDHGWSRSKERQVLDRYGAYLSPLDHWAKADRQLFDIQATATERLLPHLPADRRAEARTRIALLKSDPNGLALYRNLSATSQQDSGVLHAIVRYHRRRDQDDRAITYAGLAPLDADGLRDPDAWYRERRLLTRWAIGNARFEDAYILSAFSGLEEGADFAEAEFMAGWTALRFLSDPERAKAHFAFLSTGVTSPISLSRGEYWLGRAFAATGDRTGAERHYQIAATFPYAYYGQLAIEELGSAAPDTLFPEPAPIDPGALTVFNARPMTHAMRILARVGESYHFDRFARALDDQITTPGEVKAYHDLVIGQRKTYLAVRAGKVARNNGAEVPEVVYPLISVPERAARYVETPLILGLSRQESEFNPRAYSRARARGLMQLLASTAEITARKEGIPFSVNRLMDDPNYNLTIGAAHLNHLLDRFGGSYVLVLAAYNAGARRSDQWIEAFGDPRTPSVDPIDWVELIPFTETRNYVMRVLENTQVYRARLNGEPLGRRLIEDLTRGGGDMLAVAKQVPSPRLVRASATNEMTFGINALQLPAEKTLAQRHLEEDGFPDLFDPASVPTGARGRGGEKD